MVVPLVLFACALPQAATATTPAANPDRIGRIYSYIRSDRDGAEAETIHVFRQSRTHIGVAKMRNRCTNAAYVTADLDIERGHATRLGGGRLRPNAQREEFAVLTYDAATRRLDGRVETPNGPITLTLNVPETPWHLFDFDLASLTIAAQYRPDRRANLSFGMPLLWPDGSANPLRYLGRADLNFVREEMHEGRRSLLFEAGGPAFGDRGGPIWFDAEEGHIVEASWGIPNHTEHRDFRLRLTRVSDGGEAEWRRLLSAHFEACPETAR
ncbi:MAG: hypothetical protein AB7O91_03720 [Sphingomonas sp.]